MIRCQTEQQKYKSKTWNKAEMNYKLDTKQPGKAVQIKSVAWQCNQKSGTTHDNKKKKKQKLDSTEITP